MAGRPCLWNGKSFPFALKDRGGSVSSHIKSGIGSSSSSLTWKDNLPAPLRSKSSQTFQKLRLGLADIYLLGTAHVSKDSSRDVEALLNVLNPDCIFVELCDARIGLLNDDSALQSNSESKNTIQKPGFWRQVQQVHEQQGGSRLQAFTTTLFSGVQDDYADALGVQLGGEFQQAFQYWNSSLEKPIIVLGDRPVSLTLIRAWESLSLWYKIKLLIALIWSSVRKPSAEELKAWLEKILNGDSDILTEAFRDMKKHFPSLAGTILDERDAWLAAKLVQTCRSLTSLAIKEAENRGSEPRRRKVVAIVGAGHVPGICKWLVDPMKANQTPENVLLGLCQTNRWANDTEINQYAIPNWVYGLTELNPEMVNK